MNNNKTPTPRDAERARRAARDKKRARRIAALLLTVLILAVWGLIVYFWLSVFHTPSPPAPESTAAITETAAPETTELPPSETESVALSADQIHRGELILVSTLLSRPYVFPKDESDLILLYGNKNGNYRISSSSLKLHKDAAEAFGEMMNAYHAETGNRDYQITQAYRTKDEQTEIYDSYLETYGAEQGALLAAAPGYSEHHSGYAVDLNVFTEKGVSYSLGSAKDENPIYEWIYTHAAEYGFVLRYPAGKTAITGITNEPWHFRYVGRGHAAYMTENDLVLEEYIALLYNYPADGEHLRFTADGVSYEVFYLASTGDTTEAQLPKDGSYTVSGDNDSGFIITLYRKP